MNYRVRVTQNARQEAEVAYRWLAERTPKHAAIWYNGLCKAIEGLAQFPTGHSLARENGLFDEEIRQLLYGKRMYKYRVLFVVRGETVFVLHIRPGARQALKRGEIVWPENP